MNAKQNKHFPRNTSRKPAKTVTTRTRQNKAGANYIKNASHFPDESDRATHEEEFTLGELRTREERKTFVKN